MLSITKIM